VNRCSFSHAPSLPINLSYHRGRCWTFYIIGELILNNKLGSWNIISHLKMPVTELTSLEDYQNTLGQPGTVVVDFYSTQCPPCKVRFDFVITLPSQDIGSLTLPLYRSLLLSMKRLPTSLQTTKSDFTRSASGFRALASRAEF